MKKAYRASTVYSYGDLAIAIQTGIDGRGFDGKSHYAYPI